MKYDVALKYIEKVNYNFLYYYSKAINHTPTFLEVYFVKASIYKHLYDFKTA